MSFRVGFDMDGVLADMDGALLQHAAALFGDAALKERRPAPATPPADAPQPPPAETADPAPAVSALALSARQEAELWRRVQSVENFWETLVEIEAGTVARLAALAQERRWEVIFLTKRPATSGYTAQRQSQRWLESKGFTLPSVFVVQGSRGRIASALDLDIVVDDRPENCLDVVMDSTARAVLVWRDGQETLPAATRRLGIGVVQTVAECLDILVRVDSNQPDRPSLIERLRRAFGAKSPAKSG